MIWIITCGKGPLQPLQGGLGFSLCSHGQAPSTEPRSFNSAAKVRRHAMARPVARPPWGSLAATEGGLDGWGAVLAQGRGGHGQVVNVSGFGARTQLQTLCSRGARLCSAWPRALLC